jgi:hypothetical protein
MCVSELSRDSSSLRPFSTYATGHQTSGAFFSSFFSLFFFFTSFIPVRKPVISIPGATSSYCKLDKIKASLGVRLTFYKYPLRNMIIYSMA